MISWLSKLAGIVVDLLAGAADTPEKPPAAHKAPPKRIDDDEWHDKTTKPELPRRRRPPTL